MLDILHCWSLIINQFLKFKSTKNIDLNSKDRYGLTQFMKACINGHNDVVKSNLQQLILCDLTKKFKPI